MNILLLGVPYESWENIVKELIDKGNTITIIGWKEDKVSWIKYDVKFLMIEDLWKLNKLYSNLDNFKFFQDSSSHEMIRLIGMIGRLSSSKNDIDFMLRNEIATEQYNLWTNFLVDESIEYILMSNIPHRIWDYAIYLASKELNIKCHCFAITPFLSNVLVYDNLDKNPIEFQENKYCTNFSVLENRYKKIKKLNNDSIPADMVIQDKINKSLFIYVLKKYYGKLKRFKFSRYKELARPNTYRWFSNSLLKRDSPTWINYIIDSFRKYFFLRKLKNSYNKVSITKLDKSIPTYFFALHYQPEETILPSAFKYYDQISLIKLIYSNLPGDSILLVKEHPSQFYFSNEGDNGRDLDFYNRIIDIGPKIRLLDMSISSFDVLKSTQGIITINGTIGYEAALAGVKVMAFGRVWYKGLKNIYHIQNDTLESFFNANNSSFNQEDWDTFIRKFSRSLISCKPYKEHLLYQDILIKDSTLIILKFLQNEVLI